MALRADIALIAKVEAQAGMVNHIVLSDQEIRRCKDILSNEERVSSLLDLEIEALIRKRDMQRERLKKFHVALAPHKLVPLEILTNIFLFCIAIKPPDRGIFTVPPILTETPWVLGRICSWWRHVSRSEARLWGKVTINMTRQVDGRNLSRACDILPPVAVLSVKSRCSLAIIKTDIIPHLWRVQDVNLHVNATDFAKLWMIVSAAPQSFAALSSAAFCVDGIADTVDSSWKDAKPFRLAENLRKLEVATPSVFRDSFLSLDVPWSQLVSLDITEMKNLSLEIMVGVIHQCYSLEELAITSLYGWQETLPPQEPLHMPFLRYICIKGVVAPRLIRERSLWNNISTLDLWCAKFKDGRVLHDILKQCSRLAKLFSPVPQMPIGFTVDRTLSCPHLTYLELDNTHGTWLFSSLVAPALTELDFTFTCNFDLYPLRDMLVIYKCPLRSLSIGYEGEDPTSSICPVGLHAVLAAAPSITELNCFPNIYVEEDILQDIGTGLLMPQLANFTCWPDSLKAFVKMIETRVERESEQQHITFCDIFGYILPDSHDAEVLAAVEARLGVVRRTYGVRCGFWEN